MEWSLRYEILCHSRHADTDEIFRSVIDSMFSCLYQADDLEMPPVCAPFVY